MRSCERHLVLVTYHTVRGTSIPGITDFYCRAKLRNRFMRLSCLQDFCLLYEP